MKNCDCRYEGKECLVDANISYSPNVIYRWLKRSVCVMSDKQSLEYNPDMAEILSETLFSYFVNRKSPLRSDSKYFIVSKKGKIGLLRDRGNIETLNEYVIACSSTKKAIRRELTESQVKFLQDLFFDLELPCRIREAKQII